MLLAVFGSLTVVSLIAGPRAVTNVWRHAYASVLASGIACRNLTAVSLEAGRTVANVTLETNAVVLAGRIAYRLLSVFRRLAPATFIARPRTVADIWLDADAAVLASRLTDRQLTSVSFIAGEALTLIALEADAVLALGIAVRFLTPLRGLAVAPLEACSSAIASVWGYAHAVVLARRKTNRFFAILPPVARARAVTGTEFRIGAYASIEARWIALQDGIVLSRAARQEGQPGDGAGGDYDSKDTHCSAPFAFT